MVRRRRKLSELAGVRNREVADFDSNLYTSERKFEGLTRGGVD